MKKILLSTILAATLFSCKKEAPVTEESEISTDSIQIEKPEVEAAVDSLQSMSPAEVSKFLQTKNDTLYVTNFFATWCGPCVREIPHFKAKAEELKGSPVKVTFISLDTREVWNSEIPKFVDQLGIRNHTILLDNSLIEKSFYKDNFKEWTGNAIPFTYMRKGDKTDEYLGMMTSELLDSKIKSFNK